MDKAMEEATALGLSTETLKQFFLDQTRQRPALRVTGRHCINACDAHRLEAAPLERERQPP